MEKIAAKSRSSQAKVVGSIISITGAFVLTLYKGHSIIKAHSHDLSIPLQHPFSFLKSGDADWVIAGILLTAECLIGSLCYIVQADVLKVFPDEVTIVLLQRDFHSHVYTCSFICSAKRKCLERACVSSIILTPPNCFFYCHGCHLPW
uniref:WAT1-related protein n=1 Tax=Glycine max TaxID=3847 RepID=C6TLZ3_SOYBN|nr:unknown [Glycine max]